MPTIDAVVFMLIGIVFIGGLFGVYWHWLDDNARERLIERKARETLFEETANIDSWIWTCCEPSCGAHINFYEATFLRASFAADRHSRRTKHLTIVEGHRI